MTTQAVPSLTALDLGDTRDLRIVREGEKNTIWAFGRVRRLFFVTGHARSGTTWLAALLARHPRVFVDGEFQFQELRRGFDLFQRAPYYRATREPVHTVAESCFQDTVRLCIGAVSNQKLEADWIGDRTPRKLEVFLPGAPHFVITRDGRDVLVSLSILELLNGGGIFNEFRACQQLVKTRRAFLADADFFKKHPHELLTSEVFVRAISRRWADQVRHDMDVAEQIRAGQIDASVHTVTYEAMHADPELERTRMYQFLGVEPTEAEPLTADSQTKPGLGTDNHTSDRRKGAIGDWRTYFTDQAKAWFKEEAGDELIRLGYERSGDW
jgi:hypothetical protein